MGRLGDVLKEQIDLVFVRDNVTGDGERFIVSAPRMNEVHASGLGCGTCRR